MNICISCSTVPLTVLRANLCAALVFGELRKSVWFLRSINSFFLLLIKRQSTKSLARTRASERMYVNNWIIDSTLLLLLLLLCMMVMKMKIAHLTSSCLQRSTGGV